MLGDLPIGGDAPVTVQSMTNTDTADAESTLEQIRDLQYAGCDIVRVAVPERAAAEALPAIVEGTSMPVVADIHFNHEMALLAMEKGVAGIRINPGTIGRKEHVREIAAVARERGIVIRVGVNSGSLERRLLGPEGRAEASALATSALDGVGLLESCGVSRIKISAKASDVTRTIEAYRQVSAATDWPLHLGVTEAGTAWSGTIKSAVGIGALLAEGIGDTIRVSLSAPPVQEVRVGRKILASLGLADAGPQVISCPTCARANIDVISLAQEVEMRLERYQSPLTVAVMGCEVNGPGEAREADIGIAGGKKEAFLFVKGKMIRKVAKGDMMDELVSEIEAMIERQGG